MAKQAGKIGLHLFYMVTPDKDYANWFPDQINIYKPGRQGGDVEI